MPKEQIAIVGTEQSLLLILIKFLKEKITLKILCDFLKIPGTGWSGCKKKLVEMTTSPTVFG